MLFYKIQGDLLVSQNIDNGNKKTEWQDIFVNSSKNFNEKYRDRFYIFVSSHSVYEIR